MTGANRGTVRALRGAVASEVTRMRRRSLLIGWAALVTTVTALVNSVMFRVSQTESPPVGGPGVAFPTTDQLLAPDGLVAGLGAASSMFGVVTLAFWALVTAGDYSTGLVRILVAAQPRRWVLVIGKWCALALATAATSALALVVDVAVAPAAARAAGLEPTRWGDDLLPVLFGAWTNLFLALLVWGTIGMTVAVLTRSAGVAIGVGVGWVLLAEGVLVAAIGSVEQWLPGTTTTALARGGTTDISYTLALAVAGAYLATSLVAAIAVFTQRDVTD